MGSALDVHRLHFAFTVTYHYLFPQLTMGLALLIVVLKTMALRRIAKNSIRTIKRFVKINATFKKIAKRFEKKIATSIKTSKKFVRKTETLAKTKIP